jgi:hypothetical protein
MPPIAATDTYPEIVADRREIGVRSCLGVVGRKLGASVAPLPPVTLVAPVKPVGMPAGPTVAPGERHHCCALPDLGGHKHVAHHHSGPSNRRNGLQDAPATALHAFVRICACDYIADAKP